MLGYSNAMATAATALDRQSPWRDELRATLALAWPLILTNITMVLINSTDVFLLARLGPGALAASAMGSGIVIAMLLIGIGIVILGFLLMTGGGNGDPNAFDEAEIFSTRRITVAPIVVLIGYLFVVYAILKKSTGTEAGK